MIAFRSVIFGTSCLCASGSFECGDVSCPSSHSSIAARSYERPSAHTQGSTMSAWAIGHMKSWGYVASSAAGSADGGAAAAGAGASGDGSGSASGDGAGSASGDGLAAAGVGAAATAGAGAPSGSIVRRRHPWHSHVVTPSSS